MKKDNTTELLLFPNYTSRNFSREELVKWLVTTVQPIIQEQHDLTQKIFLKTLKDTPAIYLS